MPKYDVPIWITVEAENQEGAFEKVHDLVEMRLSEEFLWGSLEIGEPEKVEPR